MARAPKTPARKGKGVMSPLKDEPAGQVEPPKAAKPLKAKGKKRTETGTKAKTAKPARAKTKKAGVTRDFQPAEAPKVKFEKRFISMARLMFLAKVPDDDIAKSIGIDVEEMEWWKEEHPDFAEAFRPDPRNYGGRPSNYEDKFADQAQILAKLGATDLEVSQFFGVALRTIYRWKIEFSEFRQALEMGKEEADKKVEESLYRRAVGYSFDSEKIVVIEGEAQRVETIEHVPPDTKAAMFWLQNRRPGIWRDTKHIKHDVEEEGPLGKFLADISGNAITPKDQDGPASSSAEEGNKTFRQRDDEQGNPDATL